MTETPRDDAPELAALAQTVHWHRQGEGLTQAQLAERMSKAGFPWHTSTVSKTESGQRDLTVRELTRLADIFNTSAAAMMSMQLEVLQLKDRLRDDIERTRAEAAQADAAADDAAARVQQFRARVEEMRRLIEETEALISSDLALEKAYRARAEEFRVMADMSERLIQEGETE